MLHALCGCEEGLYETLPTPFLNHQNRKPPRGYVDSIAMASRKDEGD
jgi:hypothetical protein